MNNADEKRTNLITYFALISTGPMYFIISQILYFGVDIIVDNTSYFIFLIGLGTSLLVSAIIIKNAYNNEDDDRSRTIIYLSISHLPVLFGFFYWMLFAFELI